MGTITLTGINDGASSLLDAVDVEWHVCLGKPGAQTACEYGTGTISAGVLEVTTASDGYYEGTLKIVGSTEMKMFGGTSTGTTLSAPVIDSIDPQDSSLVVSYTHDGFGGLDGYYEWFDGATSLSQFSSVNSGVKTLSGLTNGVTYDIKMQANVDLGGDDWVSSAFSNTVSEAPVGTNTVPIITMQPQSTSVSAGGTAVFTVLASGTPSPTYQWQHDLGTATWTNITSETSTTLNVVTTDTSKNGWSYRCVATNSEGSATSNQTTPAILTVNAASSFIPIENRNFATGSDGELVNTYADGYDGVLTSPSRVYLSDTYANSGSLSARTTFLSGDTGQIGGLVNVTPHLVDEMWTRVYALFPTGYQFASGVSEGQKFMRCNISIDGAESNRAWDLYIHNDGIYIATGQNSTFYTAVCPYPWTGDCRKLDPDGLFTSGNFYGQWHYYELYVLLKDDATGIIRAWIDGTLAYEATGIITKTGVASDYYYQIQLFSGAQPGTMPKDEYAYLDNIVIAGSSSPPPNTDSFGNKMIGDWIA